MIMNQLCFDSIYKLDFEFIINIILCLVTVKACIARIPGHSIRFRMAV